MELGKPHRLHCTRRATDVAGVRGFNKDDTDSGKKFVHRNWIGPTLEGNDILRVSPVALKLLFSWLKTRF